jgi:tRNA 2-selenouridine synthase
MPIRSVNDFATLFRSDTPLLDLRAPIEFDRGAFPTATNLPLMSDTERAEVGTCYKQKGQQAAIELGHQLVSGSQREQRIDAWLDWYRQHPEGAIYCFRGGLRSETVARWLDQAGQSVRRIEGGYKALRRFLLEDFEQRTRKIRLCVLSGRTGCAKTRVIEALPGTIDLEGLAHHRGSSFGRRPGGQPTQIDFENRLAIALLKHQQEKPLLLEDESKLIGRCFLPQCLQDAMAAAPRVIIEEPLEARVDVTLEDYVLGPLAEYRQQFGADAADQALAKELLAAMDRIRKRLGGARHADLRSTLQDALQRQREHGDTERHRIWIRALLADYYDPMYDHQIRRRQDKVLFSGNREQVSQYLQLEFC